jgi:hypothetical protein
VLAQDKKKSLIGIRPRTSVTGPLFCPSKSGKFTQVGNSCLPQRGETRMGSLKHLMADFPIVLLGPILCHSNELISTNSSFIL